MGIKIKISMNECVVVAPEKIFNCISIKNIIVQNNPDKQALYILFQLEWFYTPRILQQLNIASLHHQVAQNCLKQILQSWWCFLWQNFRCFSEIQSQEYWKGSGWLTPAIYFAQKRRSKNIEHPLKRKKIISFISFIFKCKLPYW